MSGSDEIELGGIPHSRGWSSSRGKCIIVDKHPTDIGSVDLSVMFELRLIIFKRGNWPLLAIFSSYAENKNWLLLFIKWNNNSVSSWRMDMGLASGWRVVWECLLLNRVSCSRDEMVQFYQTRKVNGMQRDTIRDSNKRRRSSKYIGLPLSTLWRSQFTILTIYIYC